MTGIDPTPSNGNNEVREYEEDEPAPLFCIDKESGLIYEVKFFEDFAMLRLAVSNFQAPVTRVDLMEFADRFEDFIGDLSELNSIRFGYSGSPFTVFKTGK